MAVSRQTLCYVFRPGDCGQQQVLLGRKKRGFGAGKIMGLGGHAEPGESEAACALREVQEESGITIVPDSLTWRAALTFIFEMLTSTITYDQACELVAHAELKTHVSPA